MNMTASACGKACNAAEHRGMGWHDVRFGAQPQSARDCYLIRLSAVSMFSMNIQAVAKRKVNTKVGTCISKCIIP